jgi:hypothetical protein
MDTKLDVLTLLLLDPCLTADEAAREAAARAHTAAVASEIRPQPTGRRRPARRVPSPAADDGPAVGF